MIRTEASLKEYEDILKELVHPAGKKVLGDYFVYRKDFGPSADFLGYRNEQLYSPYFANYLPYGIATVSDGAMDGNSFGEFGVLDSTIDLRGVCSGFIGSGSYPTLHYDFFPYGYDGETGYTLEFPASQENNLNARTELGSGLSLGWDNQDFNKFGGVGATQEFFASAGRFERKLQEIQFYNRTSAQNRDQHESSPFEKGDIIAQLNPNGSERIRGVVYENSWSVLGGSFKALVQTNNASSRNFRVPSGEGTSLYTLGVDEDKIKNITKGTIYRGGGNFSVSLNFYSSNGSSDGHSADFFRVGDHIYQGTGDVEKPLGQVLSWIPPTLNVLVLTDNDNVDILGTSFTGGISADCNRSSIFRVKGSGWGQEELSSTTGSTSGGETYDPEDLSLVTTLRFIESTDIIFHDADFFKVGDHVYQGTGDVNALSCGYVVNWTPPYLFLRDITPLSNWSAGVSLSNIPSASDTSICTQRLFRVKGSGHLVVRFILVVRPARRRFLHVLLMKVLSLSAWLSMG